MDFLKIDLFQPGMTPLLRAGLGGLACTLNWIDETDEPIDRPPGSWTFDDRSVTLHWDGGPREAATFLAALYGLAFGISDGLIKLPGSYGRIEIGAEIRAEFQQGMSLTILQFGPNRKALSKTPRVRTYEVDGQPITIQHQDLIDYTHRSAWEDLVTTKGELRPFASVGGTVAPGFVQRHVAQPSTIIELPPGLAIAAHFALVGTLALAIDRSTGVLIVPDVLDLRRFAVKRQHLNPKRPQDCQVNGPADAALQAQIRLRAMSAGKSLRSDRCIAILFAAEPWNPNQKARAGVLDVDVEGGDLDLFEEAMQIQELRPRLIAAKGDKKGEPPRFFWSRGVVRPLIAENLARHEPWYRDFRRLIVSAGGCTDEEKVRLLGYESKGLQAMIERTPWHDRGEQALVESIHEAMRSCFAAIGENTDDPVTFTNRVTRQRQRWRLRFAGAKTPDDLREALADLWSRSVKNPTLQASWRAVLPWFCDENDWRLTRDLCLLALSSYPKSAGATDAAAPQTGK